jgi:hypothetical protein
MTSPLPDPVPLASDDEARQHLRLDDPAESPPSAADQMLTSKILQASDIVVDYIKRYDHEWDADTAPSLIKAAVLGVLTMLYDHPEDDPLTAGVKNVLHRYRDPAIA